MMTPRVSVLLPARDAIGTVAVAVRSILTQTLTDLELIAVDDGSRDGTGELLEGLAQEDSRLRVIRTPGEGLVAALARGWQHCTAEFVARMDADDVSLPERLERSVAALEADPSLGGIGTQVEILREDRPASPGLVGYAKWLSSLTSPELLARERFIESPLCHPAVTLRRRAVESVGLWREGPFAEDYELWLRLISSGWKLTNLPELLFQWRDHDRRLTWTDPRYELKRHLALKAEYLAPELRARGGRCLIWGAGPTGILLAKHLREREIPVETFIDFHPRKIGQVIHGTPVIHPTEMRGYDGVHLIAAVGAFGGRADIRERLGRLGWIEGEHFTCAA